MTTRLSPQTEARRAWTRALRSGRYEQTTGYQLMTPRRRWKVGLAA